MIHRSLAMAAFTAMLLITATSTPAVVAANRPAAATKQKSPVAKTQIVIYTDYQCPACRRFNPILKRVQAKYGSSLKVTYRNYPLPIHKNAQIAAYAAEAAALQGRLNQMHDKLYDDQASWAYSSNPVPALTNLAKSLGLDTSKFVQDLNSSAVKSKVAADMRLAQAAGVTETPTVVFNGRSIIRNDLTKLDEIINESRK
jgi:protein-disulfide isomerase